MIKNQKKKQTIEKQTKWNKKKTQKDLSIVITKYRLENNYD